MQNNGNDNADIRIYGQDLWDNTDDDSQLNYFQSKAGNKLEGDSYTDTDSQSSYTGIKNNGIGERVINDLKWKDTEDSAEIDIWIKVPQSELTTGKSATVTIKGEWVP